MDEIEWGDCPTSEFDIKNRNHIQCASVVVPLDWKSNLAKEEDKTIQFFVKRIQTLEPRNRLGQIWLLNGGPGLSGYAMENMALEIQQITNQGYDIYIPDHRGTGRSSRLACTIEEMKSTKRMTMNELNQCIDEIIQDQYNIQQLNQFTTTNAALDVIEFIKQLIRLYPGDKVVLFGYSYGTYWMNRILQIEPSLFHAVIADSVIVPTDFDFFSMNDLREKMGMKMAQICDGDSFCSGKFETLDKIHGSAEWALHEAFVRQMNVETQCIKDLDVKLLRNILSSSLSGRLSRKIIFPLLYRIIRCSRNDHHVLENVATFSSLLIGTGDLMGTDSTGQNKNQIQYTGDGQRFNDETLISRVLQRLIVCSELIQSPLTFNMTVNDQVPPYFYSDDITLFSQYCKVHQERGLIYNDVLSRRFSNFSGPIITLMGTLDAHSSYDQSHIWREHFDRVAKYNHRFISFPNAVHGISFNTNLKHSDHRGRTCGMQVISSFLQEGKHFNVSLVDVGCLNDGNMKDFPSINFSEEEMDSVVSFLFGTVNLWEGSPLLSRRQLTVVLIIVLCFMIFAIAACIVLTSAGLIAIHLYHQKFEGRHSTPKKKSVSLTYENFADE